MKESPLHPAWGHLRGLLYGIEPEISGKNYEGHGCVRE